MSANDACLGICSEPHTYWSHSVDLLKLHDEGEQPIQCDHQINLETAAENGKTTKLTFFALMNPDRVEGLKYKDVPCIIENNEKKKTVPKSENFNRDLQTARGVLVGSSVETKRKCRQYSL